MNLPLSRVISAGLFFLFIFLSGFWLSRSGKPYKTIPFNIHKLIGLAAVVFLALTVYQAHQKTPLAQAEITTIVISALLFTGTIIAGGLLSIDKPMPAAISMIHKLFPYIITLSTAVTLYLLLS